MPTSLVCSAMPVRHSVLSVPNPGSAEVREVQDSTDVIKQRFSTIENEVLSSENTGVFKLCFWAVFREVWAGMLEDAGEFPVKIAEGVCEQFH